MPDTRHHPRSLRVAFLNWRDTGHPEAGGAEVFLDRVSTQLAARGHRVTVCVARHAGASAVQRRGAVTVHRMGGRLTVYPRVLGWLVRHRRDFDVVIDVQNGLPFWAPLTGLPVVNVTHHVHREQWREVFGPVLGRAGWWLESRAAPRVYRHAHYVTVSAATRLELGTLGIDPARVRVAYSGLDDGGLPFAVDEALRSPTPLLVALGRLVPHKRVELAVDAVARLRPTIPGLRLVVVGSGYWRPRLERYARERGVADAVRFAGHVSEPDKRRLLSEAWLHVLASVKEGWGLVVVEAGVHSTPTVAFRSAGGTAESVLDGRTGVLVERPDQFAGAIAGLLTHPDRLRRMGTAARQHAAGFTWAATAAAVELALYDAVADRRREPVAAPVVVPLEPIRRQRLADRPAGAVVLEHGRAEQVDVQDRVRNLDRQAQQQAPDHTAVADGEHPARAAAASPVKGEQGPIGRLGA